MRNREEFLAEIQEGLETGVITKADLEGLATDRTAQSKDRGVARRHSKASAVDVMFYIAGIVLFSAIMSVITQTWEDGSAPGHILLSAGVGLGLWIIAYMLLKSPEQNDVRRGLVNALLLTGSLSVVVGGYIITNEAVGGFTEHDLGPAAITLLALGAIHLIFDSAIKKDLLLLMGVLLGVAAFPTFCFGLLRDANAPSDLWSVTWLVAIGLLVLAARVTAKFKPDRKHVGHAFDSIAAFLALLVMYTSSFGDYGVVWLILLIAGVFTVFYLSIVAQSKELLGGASFFLILTVISSSFKYFSGYGVTTSLIVATVGLLGSAAIASMINKKYFK